MLFFKVGMASTKNTTSIPYSRLVEVKSDDILGEVLRLNDEQRANLFWKTFGSGYLDNYKKSLTWQCYRFLKKLFVINCPGMEVSASGMPKRCHRHAQDD